MIGRGGRDRYRREYSPRMEDKGRSGRSELPPSRHLWVGNLSTRITENILSEQFLRFGELESIFFLPGRSYAFVNFKKEEDAIIAMRALQGSTLSGLTLKIEFAKGDKSQQILPHNEGYLPSKDQRHSTEYEESLFHRDSRNRRSPERINSEKYKGDRNADPSEVLWIGFPSVLNVDEISLRRAFAPYGDIDKITAFPGRSYAFVRYQTIAAACRAKEALQGKLFNNPRVSICFAKSEGAPSDHGRSAMNPSFHPPLRSHSLTGSGRSFENFHQERNFDGSTEFRIESPHFGSDIEVSGDSGITRFNSKNSIRTSGTENIEQLRFQRLVPERDAGLAYGRSRISSASDRGDYRRNFPPERTPKRNSSFEDSWSSPEDFVFHESKKIKIGSFPDKDLPEYPFSDLDQDRLHSRPPKLFPDTVDHESSDKNFDSRQFSFRQLSDFSKKPIHAYSESDELWKKHDGFDSGSTPLTGKLLNLKSFSSEPQQSPQKDEWKWEGTIAKGGSPICRARCFPVGKVLDMILPEFLDCTARTGLDMLAKHFYQATNVWVVFFVPGSDADIVFYNEFMHYLEEKQRAAVAKLGEKTTLFLVPPSEFSEKVLKVPGKMSISGVILRFQQSSSSYGSLHDSLESVDSKFSSLINRRTGIALHSDMPYPNSNSPDRRSLSQSQNLINQSLETFPTASTHQSLHKGLGNHSYSSNLTNPPAVSTSFLGSALSIEKPSESLVSNRSEQLQNQTSTFPRNWSPHQMRNSVSNSTTFLSQTPIVSSHHELSGSEYLSTKSWVAQEPISSFYTPGFPSVSSVANKLAQPELRPQPSTPTDLSTLQPEQLAQLATLIGQHKQLGKTPFIPTNEEFNQPILPNQLEQRFKPAQKAPATAQGTVPFQASTSSDPATSQYAHGSQLPSHGFNVPTISNQTSVPVISADPHGQTQSGAGEEAEADPQKKLQATLQLAAALLQQIQQQSKPVDQRILSELCAERNKLTPFMSVLPHVYRLLNQEILRITTILGSPSLLDQSGFEQVSPMSTGGLFSNGEDHMNGWTSSFQSDRLGLLQSSPAHGWIGQENSSSDLIVRKTLRVDIPVDKYPTYNFVGRLLGPRGLSLKRVEAITESRILIRGRGSIKDHVLEEMLRGKPGYEHLNEPLHILAETEGPVDIIDARLTRVHDILIETLKPVDESHDFFKKQQLRELAMLNGTFREDSPQPSGSSTASPFNHNSLGMKRAKTRV